MKTFARYLSLLALAVLVFTACNAVVVLVPRELLVRRVLAGYEEGALGTEDYPGRRVWIGIDQFSDCVMLQTMIDRQPAWLATAISARYLRFDPGGPGTCLRLRDEVAGQGAPVEHVHYHRYWFGNRTVTALLVATLGVGGGRIALTIAGYASVLLLLAVAFRRSRRLGLWTLPIALFALVFGGLPHLGPLYSHAPQWIVCWLAAALLLVVKDMDPHRLRLRAALLGAVFAYFDVLLSTPLCPLLVTAVVYLRCFDASGDARASAKTAGAALVGAGAGIVATVLLKPLLSGAYFGFGGVLGDFFSQLFVRVGASERRWFFAPIAAVWRTLDYATFADGAFKWPIVGFGLAGYGIAIVLWWRRRTQGHALLLGLACTVLLAAWYLGMANHTENHPDLMSRHVFLPLALGWTAVLVQVAAMHRKPLRARADGPAAPF